MIARIIRWSAANPFLVLLGTLFIVVAGLLALRATAMDAIPDLSDTQVIVYADYPGQAPQVVEDQITYPLTTALLTVPRSKVVRGYSFFGASFVYVVFEDGTDLYWARSRVLEYLNFAARRLPAGVTPTLGPDATGVGWVFEYVVTGAERTLAELRSIQDWFVRFQLSKADGVAEVVSIGGFVQTYQVIVDPQRLQTYGLSLGRFTEAIRGSNRDVGGRSIEMSETEYLVRGRGYLRNADDLGQIVLANQGGTPVLLRDVAQIQLGPDERRGVTELNGEGEAVAGIVLQRDGQNALTVIDSVKQKIAEIAGSLPQGVSLTPVYDRSGLIHRAIETLKRTLVEESIIVALVCVVFLLHVRSALVAIVMLPVGVLIAIGLLRALGLTSNIMSLGGIAIALGAMVDAAIVMIENAHKHLERSPDAPRFKVLTDAAVEVGPALFFSLAVITVSFLPVFTLEGQEGRMFRPLALTKTFAMAGGALLSVTLVPVLMTLFIRGRILPEHRNPINRLLIWLYRPLIAGVLRAKLLVIVLALVVLGATAWPAMKLGSEFMPTLNEGTLLFMPVSLPGLSITKAAELLQTQDKIIKGFPEVESVFGKAGRAATATDPAPVEMSETVVNLKPEADWRPGVTTDSLIAEMGRALEMPGVSSAWTMPIKARTDMLSTGIRTPVGIKVYGPDLAGIDAVTLLVIFVLLYLNFGRLTETLIVLLSVPFALIGGIWLMYLLGFNISVAAAVGFIALAGVAAETGVIMLIYLDHALREQQARARLEGRALTRADLRGAVISGAVERVRPKMMTVTAIMAGLLPILWSTGTGSELMRRIAAPMVGGMISSAVLTLLVIPAIYALVKGWRLAASTDAAAGGRHRKAGAGDFSDAIQRPLI